MHYDSLHTIQPIHILATDQRLEDACQPLKKCLLALEGRSATMSQNLR